MLKILRAFVATVALIGFGSAQADFLSPGDYPKLHVPTPNAATLPGVLPSLHGGTGLVSPTAHGIPVGEGSSPMNLLAPGTAGNCLLSNGASSDPSFQACIASQQPDDIRNYGAVCNNSASQAVNNTAITNALAAQASAFIPPCTIYVSNITATSGASIHGLGNSSVLSAFGTLSAAGLIQCTSCVGLTVSGVNIQVNTTQRTAGVSGVTCITCSYFRVQNSLIQGNYGVLSAGSSGTWVENNTIAAYGEASGANGAGDGIAIQGTSTDAYGYLCAGTASGSFFVKNNIVTGAASAANPPTPFGINICDATNGVVEGNSLYSPGYFGILLGGAGTTLVTVAHNLVYNSVHEAIITHVGVGNVTIEGNTIQSGGSSIDNCLTIDGSQGGTTIVRVSNNTLYTCYANGILLYFAVSFSMVEGNQVVNANSSGQASQAGINVNGTGANYNHIGNNTIQATGTRVGYGIYESATGGHNVFVTNSTLNMSSGNFSILGTSTSNNNLAYP